MSRCPWSKQVVLRKTLLPTSSVSSGTRCYAQARNDPKVLIVAPMSGHFATLLRGTVEAMLPEHDVYITDWIDAREVPLSQGRFDLSTYSDYIREFVSLSLPRTAQRVAVMGVCQPGVPVLACGAQMAEDGDAVRPSSTVILMGSPIDTRVNPTEPNVLATTRSRSAGSRRT